MIRRAWKRPLRRAQSRMAHAVMRLACLADGHAWTEYTEWYTYVTPHRCLNVAECRRCGRREVRKEWTPPESVARLLDRSVQR